MSLGSADTVRERGQAVDALLVAASTATPSSPWPTTHNKPRALRLNGNHARGHDDNHNGSGDRSLQHPDEPADDKTTTDGGRTTLGGDDDLVGAVDQLLNSGGGRGLEVEDGLDLCRSTWKSVETMARALAVGQSVVSTISRCYSLPELGRKSGAQGAAAAAARRSARQAGTEVMHSSLLSSRLAAKALAIFRRLGKAPPTQPDSLYINSAKLPEAAKALDPALDDAAIAAWMKANGFEQQRGMHSDSLEALSWTEYRQALADLSPTFRRHGITAQNSGECASPNSPSLGDERYGNPWEDMADRTAPCTSPLRQRRRGLHSGEGCHRGDRLWDCPPRSPGADSYGVLRRKRHAAVSLDYEGITKQLPQVMPPLDPSILVDHIKAQGRRERKHPGSDGGVSSLWTLDPHERLLKMPLQKEQVSETANPRLVQPRHAAVQLRSRRNEFGRRREAEAGLMTRLARNAGVICRQAKIAEAKKTGRDRLLADQERVEGQREEESRRSLLVRAGARHRASERRLKMEMLKSCIADQLRTIQENEERALDRVSEPAREPCLKPTVPPSDQDARWIYSSGSRSPQGPASPTAQKRRPTVTLSSLVLAKCHSDPGEAAKTLGGTATAFSPDRSRGGSRSGGNGGWVGRGSGEGKGNNTGGADRSPDGNVGGAFACASSSAAGETDVSPAAAAAAAARPAVGGSSPAAGADTSASPTRREQARSREESRRHGGEERRMRQCTSTREARLRPRSQVSPNPWRGRGSGRGGAGYGLSTGPSWSERPVQAAAKAEGRKMKMRSGLGLGNGGGSCLSAVYATPSVSPWCRQTATPSEWGGGHGDFLEGYGQDRGVVGWADDASGSNA
eukprot:g13915.t1